MNIFLKIIGCLLLSNLNAYSQIVNFTDSDLKQYLITKLCVDTTNNGVSFSNDLSVDTNGDNEIQISEALSVQHLEIEDFPGEYSIYSIQDLNAFSNLKFLKIWSIDSLARIENLNLDSLKPFGFRMDLI